MSVVCGSVYTKGALTDQQQWICVVIHSINICQKFLSAVMIDFIQCVMFLHGGFKIRDNPPIPFTGNSSHILDVLFQLIDNHCILIMTVWRSLVEDEVYRNNCAGCSCVVDGEGYRCGFLQIINVNVASIIRLVGVVCACECFSLWCWWWWQWF